MFYILLIVLTIGFMEHK